MSRYVQIALRDIELSEVTDALTALGVEHSVGERLLDGSLECAGEPVTVRVEPGPVGAVEDFGLRVDDGVLQLVCGELDRAHLEADLLPRMRAAVAEARVLRAGLRGRAEGAGVARRIKIRGG